MTRQPTAEDAGLILELYQLRREPRLREARRWLAGSFRARTHQEFLAVCPPGSEENASYRMVISYWEMVASFVTAGLLQDRLLFETNRELLVVWELVRDVALEIRQAHSDATYLRNLEQVAASYVNWLDAVAPGAAEALVARLRGGAPAASAVPAAG